MKTMILVVVSVALLSVLPYASAQQAGDDGIPTTLPGVTTAPAPSDGFDPLTASDDELAAYGFPPRPDKNVSTRAYAAWERAMRASQERVFPELELTDHFNRPNVGLGKTENGTSTSYNWSGVVDTTSTKSYGSTSIYYVLTEYVVPVASQAYGACTGGSVYSSSWVGIDGWGSNDVLQGGTESDAWCLLGVRTTTYYAWYEWYPSGAVKISSLPVSAGDDMFVEVWSTSATSGHAYLVNYNTNQSVTITFSAPSGTQLIGNSAEWVVERPTVGNSYATLTNYISDYFSSASAASFGGTAYYPASSAAIGVTMLDNNGKPISYPTLLGSYAIWLQDEGSAL